MSDLEAPQVQPFFQVSGKSGSRSRGICEIRWELGWAEAGMYSKISPAMQTRRYYVFATYFAEFSSVKNISDNLIKIRHKFKKKTFSDN
ncbi:hypothetical protein CDAR_610781 [Caerostris darwini]|uniref:Uncharacterized protein n=1 Tax=Caerostris darwini TaxID=1538125 RepID=A0AAV4Q5R1_9ARAC|nr:hypothetical protein CDAR_610781 [Caerostris darwini]